MPKPALQRQQAGIYIAKKTTTAAASSGGKENTNGNAQLMHLGPININAPKMVTLNGVGNATLGGNPFSNDGIFCVYVNGLPNINLVGEMKLRLDDFLATAYARSAIKLVSEAPPEKQAVSFAASLWPYVTSMTKDVMHHFKHHEALQGVDMDKATIKTPIWSKHCPDLVHLLGTDPVSDQDMADALGDAHFIVSIELPGGNTKYPCLFKIGNKGVTEEQFFEFMNSKRADRRDVKAWVSAGVSMVIYNARNNTVRTKIVARKVQVFDVEGSSAEGGSDVEMADGEEGEFKRPGTPRPEEGLKKLRGL